MIDYDVEDRAFETPWGNSVRFRVRVGTNDHNTLVSCLNEDEYHLRDVSPTNALDIGGYLGGVAIGLAVDHPACQVTVVEPVPDNVELIRFAAAANGVADRVRIIAGAVGDGLDTEVRYRFRGTHTAEHHAFVGNALVAYGSAIESRLHETITYRTLTIADLLDITGPVDLVKIDTEGGEWPFLATPGVERLPLIVGEWHPVQGHALGEFIALLPGHEITFSGPQGGPGGFRAVLR